MTLRRVHGVTVGPTSASEALYAEVRELVPAGWEPGHVSVLWRGRWVGEFMPRSYYLQLELQQEHEPVAMGPTERGTLWWYRGDHYEDDERMTAEEVRLTVFDRQRRRSQKFDRLRKMAARDEELDEARRERIPGGVRAFVWQRDEGRCVRCRADDDLQFDHIIPVARGGGSAIENLQILCGGCNRRKSDSIS